MTVCHIYNVEVSLHGTDSLKILHSHTLASENPLSIPHALLNHFLHVKLLLSYIFIMCE